MLDDDIHAAVVGEPPNLRGHVLRVMIHHFVGADFTGARELFVAAGGGKHPRAVQPGNLNGRLPDAAPGPQDEHVLAGR